MDLPLTVLLLAGLAVLIGAAVQGTIGLGLGLVAAPVMALLDPTLVPGTILLVTGLLPLLTGMREREGIDWRGLRFALLGRLPGTAIGVYVVVTQPPAVTAVLVAVVVLGAVALSATTWHARPTPRALLVGGAASGIGATTTSIGGPPVAILYANSSGQTLRSTMAVFFFVGAMISCAALALGGEIGTRELARAAVLLPFMICGFLLSGPLRKRVDAGGLKKAVLILCAVSATVLLLRTLLAPS